MMKKIIISIIALVILCSCAKKENIKFVEIETYRADMAGYKGLTSVNHHFIGTTVSGLQKVIVEAGSGAFVLSRKSCDHCQIVMQYINQAASEVGVDVYYIDAESSTYPIVGTDDYALLDMLLKSIEEKLNGEITLQTPHFFTIVNGKFVSSYVGIKTEGETANEKEAAAAVKKYSNALKVFANSK